MVAAVNDPEFAAAQDWYDPDRLKYYLRLWPYRDCRRPPDDPEIAWIIRMATGFGPNEGWIKARARWGDVGAALAWLGNDQERDARAELAVRLRYGLDWSYPRIARSLRPEVSRETARRWCEDGVTLMSAYLRGRMGR